jgi:hypothetical protein
VGLVASRGQPPDTLGGSGLQNQREMKPTRINPLRELIGLSLLAGGGGGSLVRCYLWRRVRSDSHRGATTFVKAKCDLILATT